MLQSSQGLALADSSILSSFETDWWRVKAPSADQNFGQGRSAERAFTPVLILFIALAEEKDNSDPG
jgi:hypothetical protein